MTIGKSPESDHSRSSTADTASGAGAPDGTPSIGRTLAQARQAAGLTVDEVSAATRVRVPIVHAVEEDDFSRCGGAFYARGHLRALARAVGADGEALVARYDAIHGTDPVELSPVAALDAKRMKADRGRPNWTGAMLVAIVAVIVLIGYNLFAGKSGGTVTGSASAPLPSTASSAPASVQPPAPAPSVAPIAAAPADKVTVKLVADGGTSWVSAMDGTGKSLFQNNLDSGADQTFTDPKQIKLVIGNAAAVHLYVNGKDLGPAGKDGQVVHLTYTPGDPQAG
ncbi:helix-turn-helix domain-containing protein [Kitasatospora viridis]|uniref:Cytoskeletal protein RodZ n=1 Tax=Kitasatospora viridis TaxID=281105 RepID=A0A561UE42_9ACTN|nr:helix-turn-helix domain-containing protein [Kitasatospora viridis]TWF97642.1 cytoskeletal protein RodZ [Kitasatospora viridis]